MCEQTEVRYLDGDVVWVKLGSCWWPGRVKDVDQLPEEILVSLKKRPIAAVQFFHEETFEYIRNLNQICLYNCRRKNEFIKKGLDVYRTRRREGSTVMDKFPEDVATAEKLTGGNPDILRTEEFAPEERPDYSNIFGGDKKNSSPEKKPRNSSTIKSWSSSPISTSPNGRRNQISSPSLSVLSHPRQITHPRFVSEVKDNSDHVVRIRQQPSITPSRNQDGAPPPPQYRCHQCDFTSSRLNVIVLHHKFHNADAANNGRSSSAKGGSASKSKSAEGKIAGKSKVSSSPNKSRARSKTVPASCETPRAEKSVDKSSLKRKLIDNEAEKIEEEKESGSTSKAVSAKSPKTPDNKQTKSPKTPLFGKRKSSKGGSEKPSKKKKNDEEIREKLLADWDEEDEEQEEKEIELIKQELSKSETDCTSPDEAKSPTQSTSEIKERPPKPKAISCFDFDDSEDANLGSELEERAKKFVENRKIPRILEDKSESASKRKSIIEEIKPLAPLETSNKKLDASKESVVATEGYDIEKTDETEPDTAETEDIEVAFKTLLDETTVPTLPEVPQLPKVSSPTPDVGTSTSLPDVVLDSNNCQNANETSEGTACLPEVASVEKSGGESSCAQDPGDKTSSINEGNGALGIENHGDEEVSLDNHEVETLSIDNQTNDDNNGYEAVGVKNQEHKTSIEENDAESVCIENNEVEVSSIENSGGDHDYSIKTETEEQSIKTEGMKEENELKSEKIEISHLENVSETVQTPLEDDEIELDINSMPVVMTDAIITEEPETSKVPTVSMSLIDLIPKPEPTKTVVRNESNIVAVPSTSVTSVASVISTLSEHEALMTTSKGNLVFSPQIPSSSGGSVVKTPVKTVKLQAVTVSTTGTTVTVSGATLSTISKLKTAGGTTLLSQKGGVGSKLVIVQASPGQQSRYTVGKSQPKFTVKGTPQIVQQTVGGNKVVILTKPPGGQQKILTSALSPQQQRILTTSGKLQPQPQRIISSTGAILTPVSPRSVVAKGTKLTPISQQQMRALQGSKQTLGPKFTMQSTQAKVILPTTLQKGTAVAQASPVRVIGTLKPQSNTILIQSTQGTSVPGTVISKGIVSTSGQLQAKITTTQSIAKLPTTKPKILASSGVATAVQKIAVPTTVAGKTVQSQQKVLGIRPALAPRMVVQKIQAPISGKPGSVGLLTNVSQVKKVSGVFPRTATAQKANQGGSQTQSVQKIISPQTVQKVITQQLKKTQQKVTDLQGSKRIPIVVSATNLHPSTETLTTQSLPSLHPLQANVTIPTTLQASTSALSSPHTSVSVAGISGTQSSSINLPALQPTSVPITTASSVLLPEQIAQVVAATPSEQLGDGTATYVLVTIDDSGAIQPYDNSTLLTYDGNAQNSEGTPRTLYIDPASLSSSGDLENIILTIDNSASNAGTVLNLGQTNALPVNPATSMNVESSATSVFNIGPSHSSQTGGSNQDILAEALANTQVFQPDNTIQDSLTVVNSSQSTVMTPRLLEAPSLLTTTPSTLHQTTMLLPSLTTVLPPPNPAGVLETSLTLNQPIMTPLEVPSSAVPTLQVPPPVPSSLELPLTITQPALSISSQAYPSLTVTSSSHSTEETTSPNTSLPLTMSERTAVSTVSFNPSMPLLSEETDSQSEIDVNTSTQESAAPPISVSSEETRSISYQDTESSVQETSISNVESLLTPVQNNKSPDVLSSYEDIPRTVSCDAGAELKDSTEVENSVDQPITTTYSQTAFPVTIDSSSSSSSIVLPSSNSQSSPVLEKTESSIAKLKDSSEVTNKHSPDINEMEIPDCDHSSSNHIVSEQSSYDNSTYSHAIENTSQVGVLRKRTNETSQNITELSIVSEPVVDKKSDESESTYEPETEFSGESHSPDQPSKIEEGNITATFVPISESTSDTEEKVLENNPEKIKNISHNSNNSFTEGDETAEIHREMQRDSLVSEQSYSSYSVAQDNDSQNSGNTADLEPQHSLSSTSHSMPLLIDEPMTENADDLTESSQPDDGKTSVQETDLQVNDSEMSFEQSER